MSKEHYKKTAV